ncbi:MAG: hypothetical protein ABI867_29340 [Kofleriaceae bacterium]
MSAVRRGELIKLARVMRCAPEDLACVDALDAGELRALRDDVSAQLFDDARPMLQRVASGARLLPIGLVARVGEKVFRGMLCAQVAGLLAPPYALAIALRMPDAFLAEVSAAIDPRSAGEVVAAIPVDRIVAVAQVLVAKRDFITMARFVDYLARGAIAAVIASIPDERDLLRIAAHVESPAKLGELVSQLAIERTRAMIAGLCGADASLWMEALAVAEMLDDTWRRTLADLAAELDPAVLVGLVETANAFAVWPSVLPFVHAMSEASRRHFLAMPIVAAMPPALRTALEA